MHTDFFADMGERVFGAIMPCAERELLFEGYPMLNLLVCRGDQDLLAFCEYLGY